MIGLGSDKNVVSHIIMDFYLPLDTFFLFLRDDTKENIVERLEALEGDAPLLLILEPLSHHLDHLLLLLL